MLSLLPAALQALDPYGLFTRRAVRRRGPGTTVKPRAGREALPRRRREVASSSPIRPPTPSARASLSRAQARAPDARCVPDRFASGQRVGVGADEAAEGHHVIDLDVGVHHLGIDRRHHERGPARSPHGGCAARKIAGSDREAGHGETFSARPDRASLSRSRGAVSRSDLVGVHAPFLRRDRKPVHARGRVWNSLPCPSPSSRGQPLERVPQHRGCTTMSTGKFDSNMQHRPELPRVNS